MPPLISKRLSDEQISGCLQSCFEVVPKVPCTNQRSPGTQVAFAVNISPGIKDIPDWIRVSHQKEEIINSLVITSSHKGLSQFPMPWIPATGAVEEALAAMTTRSRKGDSISFMIDYL